MIEKSRAGRSSTQRSSKQSLAALSTYYKQWRFVWPVASQLRKTSVAAASLTADDFNTKTSGRCAISDTSKNHERGGDHSTWIMFDQIHSSRGCFKSTPWVLTSNVAKNHERGGDHSTFKSTPWVLTSNVAAWLFASKESLLDRSVTLTDHACMHWQPLLTMHWQSRTINGTGTVAAVLRWRTARRNSLEAKVWSTTTAAPFRSWRWQSLPARQAAEIEYKYVVTDTCSQRWNLDALT